MKDEPKIKWFSEPEDHDYTSAESYLLLVYNQEATSKLIEKLKAEKITTFKAKDIFRASRLSLLGVSNSHVEKDQEKIARGKKLSPLLLVRDPVNDQVIIADGYHRLCAIYTVDEDALIPCKIV
jgi:disulfide oxidoreductase YuzD